MPDLDPSYELTKCLNAIEAIAQDLPAVEKRRDLQIKAGELSALVEAARHAGIALRQEEYRPSPGIRYARYKGMR